MFLVLDFVRNNVKVIHGGTVENLNIRKVLSSELRSLFCLQLRDSGLLEERQITDWKTVFVKRDPEATDYVKQQESEYWTARCDKIS